MAKKIDGVIEAVRYKNDQIVMVRAYERRGFTFSDRVLIKRKDLLERLKNGAQFVTGERIELMASTFHANKAAQVVKRGEKEFIATSADAERDDLEQTPVF
ncbi:MAG: hypothetical protein OZ914_08700 [Anaerolineaceae bacterium]|jgi:uncharacterized protein YjhX (UPF0386 family)|nr:hypothetical protein [Anaerolineales bacterium]MCL4259700.1 hypothetical protein [Anaerolineales bacterium]MEB2334375.1 hypothetical protein [Anaerolineaceae bacterium]OQY89939.1 MAG: hypothetical protein B6D38_05065 [Anaerolineae bacterium UTCFX1]